MVSPFSGRANGLGLGVPVLASEFSGAGMFLEDRFPEEGREFIVRDFGDERKERPWPGTAFLGELAEDAFDRRPQAWAQAIRDLRRNLQRKFEAAQKIQQLLASDYTWEHCAAALVEAAHSTERVSKQGPQGTVVPV